MDSTFIINTKSAFIIGEIESAPRATLTLPYATLTISIQPLNKENDTFWAYYTNLNHEEYWKAAGEPGAEAALKDRVTVAVNELVRLEQENNPDSKAGTLVLPKKMIDGLWANLFVAMNYHHPDGRHLAGNALIEYA